MRNRARSIRMRPSIVVTALLISLPLGAQVPLDSQRMVLATGTVCHTAPDQAAPAAERYVAGEIVHASQVAPGPGKRPWYFDSWQVKGISPTCWVPGWETVPYDPAHPEIAYGALVDHVLARTDTVTFADYVEIENLLEVRALVPGARSLVERFPALHYRSLLLMDKALDRLSAFSVGDAPLERAWVIAHQDHLVYGEPQAHWYVHAEEFWMLEDANRTAPWADDFAWAAAQRPPLGDECDADCFLGMIVQGPQMYWTRFPSGIHIAAALTLADTLVANAITFGVGEGAPTRPMIERVRTSLRDVIAPGKAAVLDRLAKLERLVK